MNPRYFDIEEYVRLVESFHGYMAPGVIIGGFMVHLALRYLPEGTLFNAICETPACLPDAIQLLTSRTMGNNRLKILNIGRFALSFYDKDKGNGYRVSLDSEKVDRWPEIRTWFFKLKPKVEQDKELLIAQIKEAGETLCEIYPIQVKPEMLGKQKRGEIVICPYCREAFPAKDGKVCRSCQGESPYIITETSEGHIFADSYSNCILRFDKLSMNGKVK
jgi:formylmethanofuran dehydrogenase subunit E